MRDSLVTLVSSHKDARINFRGRPLEGAFKSLAVRHLLLAKQWEHWKKNGIPISTSNCRTPSYGCLILLLFCSTFIQNLEPSEFSNRLMMQLPKIMLNVLSLIILLNRLLGTWLGLRMSLSFSGFEKCASSREYYWHLASDREDQWDRSSGDHS